MRLEKLTDTFLLLHVERGRATQFAQALRTAGVPGLMETNAAYDTVGLYVGPEFRLDAIEAALGPGPELTEEPKLHTIPVCYELGEDLESVSKRLGLSEVDLVSAHTSVTYTCYAVGFSPGFAYLRDLPKMISGVPRLPTPRTRVEPGSVGITGAQTGVYPSDTPGGWSLIGRTPLIIASFEEEYFPISAGDSVRFEPIDKQAFERLIGKRL